MVGSVKTYYICRKVSFLVQNRHKKNKTSPHLSLFMHDNSKNVSLLSFLNQNNPGSTKMEFQTRLTLQSRKIKFDNKARFNSNLKMKFTK